MACLTHQPHKSLWEEEESVEAVVKEGSVSLSYLYNVKTMEEIFPIAWALALQLSKSS